MTELDSINLSVLVQDQIKHITVAKAAIEVIVGLSFADDISEKLIYGKSISQVNQFAVSNADKIGFTTLSEVIAAKPNAKASSYENSSISIYFHLTRFVMITQIEGHI